MWLSGLQNLHLFFILVLLSRQMDFCSELLQRISPGFWKCNCDIKKGTYLRCSLKECKGSAVRKNHQEIIWILCVLILLLLLPSPQRVGARGKLKGRRAVSLRMWLLRSGWGNNDVVTFQSSLTMQISLPLSPVSSRGKKHTHTHTHITCTHTSMVQYERHRNSREIKSGIWKCMMP